MFLLDALLALAPLLLIFHLIIMRRMSADLAGMIAWVFCVALACLYFDTSFSTALAASLSGVVGSLPIALALSSGMLLVIVMVHTGAMNRIAVLMKTIAPQDRSAQLLVLCCGVGITLSTLGAGPLAILPAIFVALGYPPSLAILLPCAGYTGSCIYALLGTPVQVLAVFCGVSLSEAGFLLAWFMPLANTSMAFLCLFAAGRLSLAREGVVPAIMVGVVSGLATVFSAYSGLMTLAGFFVGTGIIGSLLLYLRFSGHPLVDHSLLDEKDLLAEKRMPLAAAMLPWGIMLLSGPLLHLPQLPFHGLLVESFPMSVHIVPGKPEHMRVFSQTYFWLFLSVFLSFPFLKSSPRVLGKCLGIWARRVGRPFVACTVFFAIASVYTHSGKDVSWVMANPDHNMVVILAGAAAAIFGKTYAFIAPFMGLGAGILTGSQTASIAMLTDLHLHTAKAISGPGAFIATGSAMAAGVAGMLSPAKLMSAAATIGAVGEENAVLRSIIVSGLCVTLVLALNTLVVSWFIG